MMLAQHLQTEQPRFHCLTWHQFWSYLKMILTTAGLVAVDFQSPDHQMA